MTCAPSIYQPQESKSVGPPNEHEIMVYHTMAEQAVSSKMYRNIGEKAAVMMIMLAAREMGIPPMAALNGGLNIIQGKVEISARMMSALIRKAGHSLKILENTDALCTVQGTRVDNGDTHTVTYTVQDAQKAGLVKSGGGWVKNPADMCFARAMSRLARQLFSDVIGIGYVEGEISGAVKQETYPIPIAEGIDPPKERLDDLEMMEEQLKDLVEGMDKLSMMEYLQAVEKHFGWTHARALQEFLTNKEHTLTKFEAWKEKNR